MDKFFVFYCVCDSRNHIFDIFTDKSLAKKCLDDFCDFDSTCSFHLEEIDLQKLLFSKIAAQDILIRYLKGGEK